MRTNVTFQRQSSTLDGDDLPIGRDIADRLGDALAKRGWNVDRDELDYAFDFDCKRERKRFRVMFGIVGDDDCQWLIAADSTIGKLRRALGATDATEHAELLRDIADFLGNDPQVSSIRWHTAEDWNAGATDRGSPTP